jgi:hypothetical protein
VAANRGRYSYEFSQPHFGGRVPWFLWPACGRRVTKIYLACQTLACRVCFNLVYESQAEGQLEQLLSYFEKLGENVLIDRHRVSKPKWMRWQTFYRYQEQFDNLQDAKVMALRRAIGSLA